MESENIDTNQSQLKNKFSESITQTTTKHVVLESPKPESVYGGNADVGCSLARQTPLGTKIVVKEKQIKFADVIDHAVESCNRTANKTIGIETVSTTVYQTAIRLSPRLEMRLALNHDILGDEDLISFEPGPKLESILARDLSSYHRFTGRDLMSRSSNHHRIAPKETDHSFYAQKNSKMDTPTPNRKQSSPNTWNNSACAAAGEFLYRHIKKLLSKRSK